MANVVSAEAEVLKTYSYDPFGNVMSGAPEFDSFYGYNAEETNPVTGLQYLRARYYDTDTGRFNVADTYLGDVSQPLTLNRYSYTINNPVMHIDPSGHFVLTALIVGAAVGAVVGAAISGIKSYKEQERTGKVNGWEVAKDALVGGVIGGVAGAAAGAVGAVAFAGVGAAATGTTMAAVGAGKVALGLGTTVLAGTASAVAGGIVSRGVTSALNDTASNIIQKKKLYNSAVYTQQKQTRQVVHDALSSALDPTAILMDAAIGAGTSALGYGLQKLCKTIKALRQNHCEDAPDITAQNPVDDVTPNVPELADDITKDLDDKVGQLTKKITVDDLTSDLLSSKPKHSPNPKKWIESGGEIHIDADGVWSYKSNDGIIVQYPDGYPDFKGAGLVKQEVNIGEFKNYASDFKNADVLAPDGPRDAINNTWHHLQDNQTLQEIDKNIHKMFTHIGGMATKQ